MGLQLCSKVLQSTNLAICLSEMLAQDGEYFPFRFSATWVYEIEVDNATYFVQAESKFLQLINFPQAGKRLFGIVVLAMSLTLTGWEQPYALVIAHSAWSDLGSFCQFTYAHTVTHRLLLYVTLTSCL